MSTYPAITLIDKTSKGTRYAACARGFTAADCPSLLAWLGVTPAAPTANAASAAVSHASVNVIDSLPPGGAPIPIADPKALAVIRGLEERLPRLEECGVEIGIGIASGCDDVYITKDAHLVEEDRLLPLFFMRDCRAGLPQERFLVNPWASDGTLVDLDEYPRLKKYFSANEERLRARRVAKEHPAGWYRTLDKLNPNLSGSEMLLFPDMSSSSDPVLSDGSRYPHHNCYWLTSCSWGLEALGGLLMSDIAAAFVDAYGVKMRGETLRFQAQYLRMVRIPRCEDVPDDVMERLADAFRRRDRSAATQAAREAYAIAEEAAWRRASHERGRKWARGCSRNVYTRPSGLLRLTSNSATRSSRVPS